MSKSKICFICSSGGHFSEINKLSKIVEKYDCYLVTEKISGFVNDFCDNTYFIPLINRKELLFIFKFLWISIKELFIFLKEKPDFIISTGALVSYPTIIFAKIFKRKIIFIESFARVNDLSSTGKKVYNIADLFFVQWPELVDKYPKSIYIGNIFGEEIKI